MGGPSVVCGVGCGSLEARNRTGIRSRNFGLQPPALPLGVPVSGGGGHALPFRELSSSHRFRDDDSWRDQARGRTMDADPKRIYGPLLEYIRLGAGRGEEPPYPGLDLAGSAGRNNTRDQWRRNAPVFIRAG